jgi:hypothetical protein
MGRKLQGFCVGGLTRGAATGDSDAVLVKDGWPMTQFIKPPGFENDLNDIEAVMQRRLPGIAQIAPRSTDYPLAFTGGYRIGWTRKRTVMAGLDFDEAENTVIPGDDVDFAAADAIVTAKDVQSDFLQGAAGHLFTAGSQAEMPGSAFCETAEFLGQHCG